MKTEFLIHYHYAKGEGRTFADLNKGGIPRRVDIEAWENTLMERNPEYGTIIVVSFQQLENDLEPSYG